MVSLLQPYFLTPKLFYLQIKVNLLEILKLVDIMSIFRTQQYNLTFEIHMNQLLKW